MIVMMMMNKNSFYSVVDPHFQPCDVFPTQVIQERVSWLGTGDWLAFNSIISMVNSCCDDIQTDEHHWNY